MTHPLSAAERQACASAETFAAIAADAKLCALLDAASNALVESLRAGKKVLACGNGGSATDANHLAEELIGRYHLDRQPFPAVCLSVDGGAITCIANDYGYEEVFARQVEALGQPGDVFAVFTTSGNSPNALRALEVAGRKGMVRVGMLGKGGGKATALCEFPLVVPSDATARIQEAHALFLHILCQAVDDAFAKKE